MSSEAPEGWSVNSLGELADLIMGQSPPSSVVTEGGEGLPFIQGNAEFGARHPTPRLVASTTPKVVQKGDILISVRAPVGEVNIAESPLCIGRGVGGIRAKHCDPDFLFYAVGGLSQTFARLSQGSTFDAINGKELRSIEILVPPKDEQRQIAEVLRSIDEQTDLTKRVLAATKGAKNAALITALRTNSWPTVQVDDLLADTRTPMRSGPFGSALLKSELTESGVPLLGIDNVHTERFVPKYRRFVSEAKYQELARYTVFPGDVMVTIMGTVGRCCVVPEGIGRAISSKHVWTMTLDTSRYSPSLLAWQINHEPRVLEQLRGSAQGGIMSAISSETLRTLRVSQPPRAEMLELEHLITSANVGTSLLEAELASLARLKEFVSSDLLSGRVRLHASAPVVPTERVVQPAFKRAVFAAEVVHQLHNEDRFGSVKHEKIVHLCELHLRLQDDLNRHAYKEAAGPYDPSARRSVERIFRQQRWFDPTKQDKRIVYRPLEASGGHARYFDRYFGDRKAEVQNIIDLLRPLTTQQCEIIATLYAVWNDFLIDGHQPDDDEIVDGVLNNWTDSKRQIPEEKWRAALPWMRQKGLIPAGHGEKTRVAST